MILKILPIFVLLFAPALSNPRVVANMEYLLTAVDVANEMLNGEPISNYGTGEYRIGFKGIATRYSTGSAAAISFGGRQAAHNTTLAGIDGSVGAIFGTIGDGSVDGQQPKFYNTFVYCDGLTGKIPSELFAGVHGSPTDSMFYNTFGYCKNLSGEIPVGLFGAISGDLQENMFDSTFLGCHGLSGPSAKIGDKYLYEIWDDTTTDQVAGCYRGVSGLTDYADIPAAWK